MEVVEQIEKFKEFLEENYRSKLYKIAREGKRALVIDFKELSKYDPELADQLLNEPDDILKAAELSLEQFDLQNTINIRIRIKNLPETQNMKIKDVRSEHLGKFVAIEGLVKQASDIRPQVTSAKFECPACGNAISILQLDIKFKEPTRCSCGRRGRFRLIGKELVDAQRLVIEEVPESLEGGEQPKRLAVILKEDLVEPIMEKKTTPGSKVRVVGIIKEVPIMFKSGVQSVRYDLVVECNYIEPLEESYEELELDSQDVKEIKKLASDPQVYDKFKRSIAPSIYGHDGIKEALVLQLMGGVKKTRKDGTMTRGDMHILLVGDPGAAKSTILTFIAHAAPKARYVAGRGVTGAGITASVVKDEFLKGWALEAGALVLANNGFCCIDEMDKMEEKDTSALHEAMAQQQISISKANIQATLRAQTTILAAANPELGRFDPYKTIASQIKMPPTLINRFDLIFPVRDVPDEGMDTKIATHVLNLQRSEEDIEPEVPSKLLKKYVSYVRKNVFPKLTEGAVDEIKDFYVKLRNSGAVNEDATKPIPISARQLEALVRLAEASARVRLAQTVTRSDARRAIRILRKCLMDVGFDYETKQLDIDRISTGISTKQRNKIMLVKDIINKLEKKNEKKIIPIDEIIAEAGDKQIDEASVEEVIERLKREGEIFEPRRGFIQKVE